MTLALILLLFFLPPGLGNDLYALPKAAVACLAIAASFWRKPGLYFRLPEWRPWACLAVALGISTLLSWDVGYSLVSVDHSRGLGLFEWAVCALCFFYGCNIGYEPVDSAILYCGGIMAAFALLERVLFFSYSARASWGSTQGSPVVLGEMLAVCFPRAFRLDRRLGCFFIFVATVTECRSAVIAMVISAVYLAWTDYDWRNS